MRIRRVIIAASCVVGVQATRGDCQTFVQLSEMGSGIGPRLTRSRSRDLISRDLFHTVGTFVSYIEGQVAYEFASDPTWRRVVFGQTDVYINEFTNASADPLERLNSPRGLDVTAKRTVLIADFGLGAIVIARFDPAARSLSRMAVVRSAAFADGPVDVAWDGQSDPLNQEYFYVLGAQGRISYWQWNGLGAKLLWSFMPTEGNAAGQLHGPTGICVGRSQGVNGGTVFTQDLFVADAGNRRIARFQRTASGLTWIGSVTLPNAGVPSDCATDHFGNVYAADRENSRLVKYTGYLYWLANYGTYGRGSNNLNTLSRPHALHHPIGIRTNASGQSVVYSEGRLITAEDWGDSSGAVEHYLGMSGSIEAPSVADPDARVNYTATDNAYTFADVYQSGVGVAQTLINGYLMPAGQFGVYWDGRLANGEIAPDGYYRFRVSLSSAYTCPSGATWCWKSLYSAEFWHRYCVEGGGGGGGDTLLIRASVSSASPSPAAAASARSGMLLQNVAPPTCGSGGAYSVSGALGTPRVFGVRQLPGAPATLAEGLTALAAVSELRPSLSVAGTALNVPADAGATLRREVRERGLTALQINLSEPSDVHVEILDLGGRRVWHLDIGQQAPGMYVLRWRGTLDGGGRARPGVYQAVVGAQGQRALGRLVLTAEP